VGGVILILVSRRYLHKYTILEDRFIRNLNEKEDMERRLAPVTTSVNDKLRGYDVHIEPVVVPQNSEFVGHRLKTVPIRSESGASIIKIGRGSENIVIPSGDVRLYPFDRMLAVGTTEQLGRLKKLIEDSVATSGQADADSAFKVISFMITKDSYLFGKTLRECSLSDYQCLVISVMRNSEFVTNPKPDFVFKEGDTVWLAGQTDSCEWLKC